MEVNKNKKKGFTLVELLAVIVILAIILVIAVPKVMSVIEDAKKATLESTAKMIASQAEKAKVQNTVLGNNDAITCASIAQINNVDYKSCNIEFVGNIAHVTIKGDGKFGGLSVCEGTKTNAKATKEGCGLVSLTVDLAGGTDNVDYEQSYEAGSEVTLTDPTREGYSFMGWGVTGLSASIIDDKLTIGTTSTTVTASWEEYSEDYPTLLSGPTIFNVLYDMGLSAAVVEFEFVDSYTVTGNEYGEAMDASNNQDGSILVYLIPLSASRFKIIVVGNGSGGILLNEDSSMMFANLSNLKEIKGMDLLRWVNVTNTDYMFASTDIASINLGTAKNIGGSAFYGCKSLKSINVSENNVNNVSINGVLYSGDLKSLVRYPEGKTDTTFIIPNSVISIGDGAFNSCTSLTSITIPNSVTSIGDGAFSGCTGLTSITIPNSVTSIGDIAFNSCTSLTSITIPNSVTSIGEEVFVNCDSLTSVIIGDGLTSIEHGVFMQCYSLKNVTIGNSVTSIGEDAFNNCTSLTSVTIPNSVTIIGNRAFYNCSSLTSITIPNSVTSIGNYTFENCTGLTSITIPNSVTSIGGGAFQGCTGLTSITIPNSVTSIERDAFSGCTGLTSITIPNSVTFIGNGAFRECTSLKDVYYTGTSAEWNGISIGSNNEYLTNATKHYEHVVE